MAAEVAEASHTLVDQKAESSTRGKAGLNPQSLPYRKPLSPAMFPSSEALQFLKIAPQLGDQMCKYIKVWEILHIQTVMSLSILVSFVKRKTGH